MNSGPIRVLHILHSMSQGGAETMLMNYYRQIDRHAVQFDFLLTSDREGTYEKEILQLGGRIYRLPLLTKFTPWKYLCAIDSFFKKHKEYRIVHSHTSSKSVFPLWIAKRNHIPVRIAHSHIAKTESGLNGYIRDFLKPFLKWVTTDFFACGKDAGIWLYGQKFCNTHEVVILNNAIQAALYRENQATRKEMREKLYLEENFVVGHVGRFSPQKNHTFIIDVFSAIYQKNSSAKLLLIGDGPLRGEIERKIASLGLTGAVILAGNVPDVYNYMQAMDVFLFPSNYEGLPLVLIEAQSNGLRCFSSAGAVTEEVNLTRLVEYIPLSAPVDTWADKVLAYAGGYPRKDTYAEIGATGYDVETAVKRLQHFYIEKYMQ